MKRNQKKYTKKNKGGATNKLIWDASVSAINKKLSDLETRFGVIGTKLGNIGSVTEPSREYDTRLEEAGYPQPPIGQNNPMNPNFASKPSNSGENPVATQGVPVEKNFPTEINRDVFNKISHAFDQLNKNMANKNQPSFNVQKSILNSFRPRLMERSHELKTKTKLNSEEEKELEDINYSLDLVNQAKATNYKGGATNKLIWDASVSAINKKLSDLETRFGVIETKLGNIGSVTGPSRSDNTGFEEAGYPQPPIGQNNPMNPNFVSSPSNSGKLYNGSTPITDKQYKEVDDLNRKIKELLKEPKTNKDKLKTLNGLKNALFAKYEKRIDYLENAQRATRLTQEETDELNHLKTKLRPGEPLGGGHKSRRYRKSRKGKRTRKHKK